MRKPVKSRLQPETPGEDLPLPETGFTRLVFQAMHCVLSAGVRDTAILGG
jgi:hypothetical protein